MSTSIIHKLEAAGKYIVVLNNTVMWQQTKYERRSIS